jgi:antitoxin component YwqK of YwqJK toxin-antitoxin module
MRILSLIFLVSFSFELFPQLKKEYYDPKETQLKSETDYYKGIAHGLHTEYYKNGNVSRKGFYNYGKEDSVWIFFYEDGTIKALERYYKGKKYGTNRYNFKSGKIAQINRY